MQRETSRDRPKSAPYLRLKNSKRTSKCRRIGEFGTFYEKKLKKSLTMPKKLKRRTLWYSSKSILLQNSKKNEGDSLMGKKLKKSRTVPKKSKAGTLWSRPVLYVTRETFLVQFLGPTGTIWRLLKIL